jgi:N-acetylglucosaminyldiphosphoundecaprenol N-acetyl-beta-D-mannosaminyltransferase
MLHSEILGVRVAPTTYEQVITHATEWADAGVPAYVCMANVHMIMEAHDSPEYRRIVNGAHIVAPDGVPLVWALNLLGRKHAVRVYGPDLTQMLVSAAAERGIPVGFYGGSRRTLERLVSKLLQRHPALRVVYSFSPPFRQLTADEDERITLDINRSGARIIFVGLGCPKQEQWMAAHAGQCAAVMLGVGAAFDFLAGVKPQAPRWMMRTGLEWLFRLLTEPRRLWERYLRHNPRFLVRIVLQLTTQGPRFEHR